MYNLIPSWNRAFYKTIHFLLTIPVCHTVLVNRTIDNSFGDPVTGFKPIYQGNFWRDQNCKGCILNNVQPDIAKAFDGTWNWAFYAGIGDNNLNITLRFTGVAIWVFFILLNFSPASTNVNITLDGQHAGIFSYNTVSNSTGEPIYNATIFSTSSLTNVSHELVIGMNDYPYTNYLNFDWAIYSVDLEASPSPNVYSSTSVASSTTSSSSTASTTPTPQSSSPKISVIVGCTLGGLAVITPIIVFLVRSLRRASPVQNGKGEGILDIDVPLPHQPYRKREVPVSDHDPTQSKAARLREARQRELDERIQCAQHELNNFKLRLLQNARSTDAIGDPSVAAAGPSQPNPELALLRNEIQQIRDQMEYLQAQRESDWALGLSNEPLPPAYSQLSNNVQE